MSRLYFHSPSGEAELLGSERHWLGGLVSDLAVGALGLGSTFHVDRLIELLSPKHYLHGRDTNTPGWILAWRRDFESAFRLGWDDSLLVWRGKDLATFTLQLNTAMQLGNDAVKLAARLHGQCELHAWVDGPNRAWLADIMQASLDSGVFRKGFWYEPNSDGEKKWQSQGWPEVIALLRARDDEPVVTSYSVCDSFPNSLFGDWASRRPGGVDEDDHADAWYDLDTAEKWAMAMPNLRECPGHLELTPDDWNTYRFGHKLSVLDLFGDDYRERLDAATDRVHVDVIGPGQSVALYLDEGEPWPNQTSSTPAPAARPAAASGPATARPRAAAATAAASAPAAAPPTPAQATRRRPMSRNVPRAILTGLVFLMGGTISLTATGLVGSMTNAPNPTAPYWIGFGIAWAILGTSGAVITWRATR